MKYRQLSLPLQIVLLYAVLSALWILFSDYLLHVQVSAPLWHVLLTTGKGWGFVVFSAVLLYVVLRRALHERERFSRELEAHARQQEAVVALQQQALNSTDEGTLLDEAAMLVSLTLDIEHSSVLELCPDGQSLRLRAGVGCGHDKVGVSTIASSVDTLAGYTLRQGEPVVVEDMQARHRFVVPPCLMEQGLVSGITVRIPGRDQPFGVLGAYSSRQRLFTQDECQFLKTIAHVLSTAISRGRAEVELRWQKTLFECQSEAAIDGIIVLDPERRVVSYNQRFGKMWGVPLSVMAEGAGDRILAWMQQRVTEPQPFATTLLAIYANRTAKSRDEIVLKDGRVFDRYSAPVEDEVGIYYGRVWYYRDITDVRRTEQALREREETFRILVSSMDDIVFTLDREQRHTGVYGRWLQRYDVQPALFLGKTPHEVSADKALADLHEAANVRALAGEDVVYEWSPLGANGPLSIQTWLSPIRDAQGAITGLVGVGRDITALKQAEEAYRVLVEHSLQGLTIFQDERLVFANQAMAALTGYTVEELLAMAGNELNALIYADDRALVWEDIAARLAGKAAPAPQEYRLVRKNGEVRWVETTGFPIQYRDKMAAQGAFIDITERKQVEAEITRHNQELAALNRITEAMNTFLELPDLLTALHVLLSDHLHIPAGAMFLYHQEYDELSLALSWGIPSSRTVAFHRLLVDNAYNERVVRSRTPVLLHTLDTQADWLPESTANGVGG